jgi:hypothetical protein
MLPKALSCSHVYWGRVEGGTYFILMLSVRILGDGGWQLLQVGPWLPSSPPPPTSTQPSWDLPMYWVLCTVY